MTQTLVTAPDNLQFYKPSRDTYAVAWRINPIVDQDLDEFYCDVQVDSSSTFGSVNLKTYTKDSSNLTYQNGYFFKSYVFNDFQSFADTTLYFRVRINSDSFISSWSDYAAMDFKAVSWYSDTELARGLLPGSKLYVRNGMSNFSKIIEAYMREMQDLKKETEQVKRNINFYRTQDEDFYNHLGILMEQTRNSNRPFVEYRGEVLQFWESFQQSGTEAGIKQAVKAILGQDPEFIYERDLYGWIVHDINGGSFVMPEDPHGNPDNHFYVLDGWSFTTLDGLTHGGTSYGELAPRATPYSRIGKGNSVIIKIFNPFNLTTRHDLIEELVHKLKPANVNIYFEYYRFDGYGTQGWGDSQYWGSDGYWGQQGIIWSQYVPED